MSHFSVLCVGDPEVFMERFSEHDKRYYKFIENTKEFKQEFEINRGSEEFLRKYPDGGMESFAKWYGHKVIHQGEEIPESSYALFSESGDRLLHTYLYKNPDTVYDYYDNGDFAFVKKDGTTDNTVLKSEVDWEATKKVEADAALENYRRVLECCEGPIPEDTLPFEHFRELAKSGKITEDEANDMYWEQPAAKNFEKNCEKVFGTWFMGWGFDVANYKGTEEEYLKRCDTSLCYGIVVDGEYVSKGNVGYFGMCTDNMSSVSWSQKFWEIIERLPEDAELHMLDCHI